MSPDFARIEIQSRSSVVIPREVVRVVTGERDSFSITLHVGAMQIAILTPPSEIPLRLQTIFCPRPPLDSGFLNFLSDIPRVAGAVEVRKLDIKD